MSHYFTTDSTEHDYKEIEFHFSGHTFKFKTDRGVFSKDRVDYGTEVLLKGVIKDADSLEALDIIDMGAGYGPIGITAAGLFHAKPLMVEVNEDAVELLSENIKRNNVDAKVMTRRHYDEVKDIKVDMYITNPPFRAGKNVVLDMVDDAFMRLNDEGAFYMVVQKKQGMPSYRRKIEEVFGSAEVVLKDKGYYVLKGHK